MQKKLIALAVAGVFAAPAFAATSNVDVGGYLNMSIDYLDSDNAAAGTDGKLNVSSNASNIYFKGAEDLGGGLSAVWQIQTYFSAGGTGNTDISFGATANGIGSGNTFVGLASKSFGKVLLGKHESPYKLVGRKYDFFGNQIGDSRNIIAVGQDIRPNNAIVYATPDMGGLSAMVAYTTNLTPPAGVANDYVATPAVVPGTLDAWAANLGYDNGPLSLGLGYQKVNNSNVLPTLEDATSWRLGASYAFGGFKVAGLYQANDFGTVEYDAWGLGAAYKMGAMTFKGQYYTGEADIPAVTGVDADMWAVGVDYALSKRTTLYGAYTSMDNGANMSFTPFSGGHGDNPGTVAGGDPSGFSLGVVHKF